MTDKRAGAVVEDAEAESRLGRIRKLLAKAESTDSGPEAEALTERAAMLMAVYGIDRAMLAASGEQADKVIDRVILTARPFAEQMSSLLWSVAGPMRAHGISIKRWNPESGPKAKGGRPRGGWDYGLRIFAYESDMQRIEAMYASLRNQALAGASRIRDDSTEFGQRQKAEREAYLEGFAAAVYWRIAKAEKDARKAQEARDEELKDKALLSGGQAGPGVALVLADRKQAVEAAFERAYGITHESKAAAEARRARRREEWQKEVAECPRCSRDRACSKHGTARGRTYEKVGSERWYDGYHDGEEAELGLQAGVGTQPHSRGALTD